ncbi:hypothetical protein RZS08_59760, partial [Arthrospira platensis SPKY1]|nr:hypothetical protein [Arthrospira platensis SPKY1]
MGQFRIGVAVVRRVSFSQPSVDEGGRISRFTDVTAVERDRGRYVQERIFIVYFNGDRRAQYR